MENHASVERSGDRMIETGNTANSDSLFRVKQIPFPLFRRHPLLAAFATVPGWCLMFGYFAVIALASWWRWPWLTPWLDLCSPLVDVMREFLPVFGNFERSLVAAGFGHRVAVIQHLLMVGWLFLLPWLVIGTAAVLSMSWSDWTRWASEIPLRYSLFCVLVGLIAAGHSFDWIIFGWGVPTDFPLYAVHRYDPPLFMISTPFLCALDDVQNLSRI